MIVLTAQMWPQGNEGRAYELLNMTISNQGTSETGDSYFSHVLMRPAPHIGIFGYEADVEVKDHKRENGLAPLLIAVLAAAATDKNDLHVPPSRTMERLVLQDVEQFALKLKGRT